MSSEEEEQYLEDALGIVKAQAFQIKDSIDKNQLRICLKNAGDMLNELKTCLLGARSYYHLYTTIFDEIQYLVNYFREEARRGRKMRDLYIIVQQAGNIIPRLYLMICVASIDIESGQSSASEVMFDLFQMLKGIQNPLRGLFVRYFLLKILKDKLPDKGNEYERPNATAEDTLKFLMQNLDEMNKLWIRLSQGFTGEDLVAKEKERSLLKILIGENLTRLSSLNCLTIELYQNDILPKIIEIILESKDPLSQQYLMECIISVFPDDYNISCMSKLLDTCTKLQPSVDVKQIFISLMGKLTKYVERSSSENEALSSAEKIFSLLKANIEKIVVDGSSGNMDSIKILELEVGFIQFTIKCCPNKDKLSTINHILYSTVSLLSRNKGEKITREGVGLVSKLLSTPIDSTLSIFEMPNYPELMKYLDYTNRVTLSKRIIEALVLRKSIGKIDSSEKMATLVDFIRPLMEDSPDTTETTPEQLENEQSSVARVIFIIATNDPSVKYDMLSVLKTVFIKGGSKRMKYTLPSLINAYISLAYGVSYSFARANGINDTSTSNEDYASKFDVSSLDSVDLYMKFMHKIYLQINDTLTILFADFPEIAFNLYLTVAMQINAIKIERYQYEMLCYNLLTSALAPLQEGKFNKDKSIHLFNHLIGTICSFSILSKDNLLALNEMIVKAVQVLQKKRDQCIVMLNCTHLYYNDIAMEKAKIADCLSKAHKFASFAMTNPQNAILFVYILNKYLYFIEMCSDENFLSFIQAEDINDIIELIKNQIDSIKLDDPDSTALPQIETYYLATINIIERRKKNGGSRILDQVII